MGWHRSSVPLSAPYKRNLQLAMMPQVCFEAVVVSYNSADHIRACLMSLLRVGAHVIVVDNGSSDDTLGVISAEFPGVLLIRASENLGYGKALNLGIAKTDSLAVLAANADTVFPESSLETLARFLEQHPGVGVVGAQEVFPDGSWQRSWGDIPSIWEATKSLLGIVSLSHATRRLLMHGAAASKARHVGYVDGAVMMIRREAFEEIGGFDEQFGYYCEDADLCLRLRMAGWDVMALPSITVVHVRGGSSTRIEGYSDRFLQSLARAKCQLLRKHGRGWHVWLYRQICALHALKMMLIYRLLQAIRPASCGQQASTMALTFEREAHIWTEPKAYH